MFNVNIVDVLELNKIIFILILLFEIEILFINFIKSFFVYCKLYFLIMKIMFNL